MSEKYEFFIAGVQFHQAKTVINELEIGDELEMLPEPSNKFDPNAIKLMYGETMLGYVPAKFSGSVSAFLETAEFPLCKLTFIEPRNKTYEQLKCIIKDEEYTEEDDWKKFEDEDDYDEEA